MLTRVLITRKRSWKFHFSLYIVREQNKGMNLCKNNVFSRGVIYNMPSLLPLMWAHIIYEYWLFFSFFFLRMIYWLNVPIWHFSTPYLVLATVFMFFFRTWHEKLVNSKTYKSHLSLFSIETHLGWEKIFNWASETFFSRMTKK